MSFTPAVHRRAAAAGRCRRCAANAMVYLLLCSTRAPAQADIEWREGQPPPRSPSGPVTSDGRGVGPWATDPSPFSVGGIFANTSVGVTAAEPTPPQSSLPVDHVPWDLDPASDPRVLRHAERAGPGAAAPDAVDRAATAVQADVTREAQERGAALGSTVAANLSNRTTTDRLPDSGADQGHRAAPGKQQTEAAGSDPVDPGTGSFSERWVDLSVPGVGLDLVMARARRMRRPRSPTTPATQMTARCPPPPRALSACRCARVLPARLAEPRLATSSPRAPLALATRAAEQRASRRASRTVVPSPRRAATRLAPTRSAATTRARAARLSRRASTRCSPTTSSAHEHRFARWNQSATAGASRPAGRPAT